MSEKLLPRYKDGEVPCSTGRYEEIGNEIGALVDKKNQAYGDAFNKTGDILRLLYPRGISPDQYDDALALLRIIDKMFRIATHKNAFGENPFRDIAGYGILKCRDDSKFKSE